MVDTDKTPHGCSDAQMWTLPTAYGTFQRACAKKARVMHTLQPAITCAGSASTAVVTLHGASKGVKKWEDMTMSEWNAASQDAVQVRDLRSALGTIDRSTFQQFPDPVEEPLRAFTQALTWCMDTSVLCHRTTQGTSGKVFWSAIASAQEQHAQELESKAIEILAKAKPVIAEAQSGVHTQGDHGHCPTAAVPTPVYSGSPASRKSSLADYLDHLSALVDLSLLVANQRPVTSSSQARPDFFDLREQANRAKATIALLERHNPRDWPVDESTDRDEGEHWLDIPLDMHEQMQRHLKRGDGPVSSYSAALATRAAQAVYPTSPASTYSACSDGTLEANTGDMLGFSRKDVPQASLPALRGQALAGMGGAGLRGSTSSQST